MLLPNMFTGLTPELTPPAVHLMGPLTPDPHSNGPGTNWRIAAAFDRVEREQGIAEAARVHANGRRRELRIQEDAKKRRKAIRVNRERRLRLYER